MLSATTHADEAHADEAHADEAVFELRTYSTEQPNTLVYIIRHDSRDAAAASWAAFIADPDWQEVARKSQLDGQILIKNGVRSQFLRATDYSPIK